ncbi:hypothetical protein ACFFGH_10095 [Lysobacter korlensis]|uniref:Lipoprotein n=1 Tax=Lysobacter korlensis TaxID=553636 RepID=A0ABV6RMI0_9GAMM
MKVIVRGVVLGSLALVMTGCSPFPQGLAGDPLPPAVDLPSLPEGARVDYVTELDGVDYYVVEGSESSRCIVHYASETDWSAGCGPSIRMTNRGTTVAWFEDGAPTDDWSELGGGLWITT